MALETGMQKKDLLFLDLTKLFLCFRKLFLEKNSTISSFDIDSLKIRLVQLRKNPITSANNLGKICLRNRDS